MKDISKEQKETFNNIVNAEIEQSQVLIALYGKKGFNLFKTLIDLHLERIEQLEILIK